MRDENLEIVSRNMFLAPERREELTPGQQLMLDQVTDCYNLQLQRPMYSRAALRNYLVGKYKISKVQAYKIIQYAAVLLGNVQASHKNWVRQRIEFLSEKAYTAAINGDYKLSEQLTKIANVLSKAFATNLDEGEIINAQQYLEIDQVVVSIDPSVIGIKRTEAKQKEIDRMLRKYQIEDVEAEEIKEDGEEQ